MSGNQILDIYCSTRAVYGRELATSWTKMADDVSRAYGLRGDTVLDIFGDMTEVCEHISRHESPTPAMRKAFWDLHRHIIQISDKAGDAGKDARKHIDGLVTALDAIKN